MPKKTKPPTLYELLHQADRVRILLMQWINARDIADRVPSSNPDVLDYACRNAMSYQFEYLYEYDRLEDMYAEHRTTVNKLVRELKDIEKMLRP